MIVIAKSYDDIQQRYIAELRGLLPEVKAWWGAIAATDTSEAISLVWPTGISGHPRFLHTFRTYYFEVENLNRKNEHEFVEQAEKSAEEKWGIDDLGDSPRYVGHIDLLIDDIPSKAPDLVEVVNGFVFLPIGLDQDQEIT
ncbi:MULTISPECIES: hypothetical protein [Mesorhizobium]|uniref:Uncharacterized protein n=1 Tax=Mesorhizobium shonense TaxID=1209948 RepID=A0ABV2HMI5_9HYPH|nr:MULTISPECIES: hypothetical protein [unclassified Mesorhizobium]AZO31822.1 hypothetical protein EJ071_33475 [Mesorhizobium sp. M1B.F.Ca.ET.045.04.1.1]RWB20964.1 MAG: hypothetical protein EOQ40_12225 [Mesorhizobium sp.]RWD99877.1 MAG: hypothetical protein EOS40_17935 [Mesorhizobium sp.]TIS46892.1 MAG: hypothetical protein E5W96_25120 [Mesorhizobium sp.]